MTCAFRCHGGRQPADPDGFELRFIRTRLCRLPAVRRGQLQRQYHRFPRAVWSGLSKCHSPGIHRIGLVWELSHLRRMSLICDVVSLHTLAQFDWLYTWLISPYHHHMCSIHFLFLCLYVCTTGHSATHPSGSGTYHGLLLLRSLSFIQLQCPECDERHPIFWTHVWLESGQYVICSWKCMRTMTRL